ncbi:MAG: hypothetical protein N2V77_02345 [Canidatus Methanoxibalbensis ujae]|nr:hypothetical protein [Candidatus Methanoxibalbensis ujae]
MKIFEKLSGKGEESREDGTKVGKESQDEERASISQSAYFSLRKTIWEQDKMLRTRHLLGVKKQNMGRKNDQEPEK